MDKLSNEERLRLFMPEMFDDIPKKVDNDDYDDLKALIEAAPSIEEVRKYFCNKILERLESYEDSEDFI